MYYSAIGLLAILILIIVNQDILRNTVDSYDKPAWKAYRRFLYAVLVYYIVDVLWGILESRKLASLLITDTTIYFVAMAMGLLFWARFTVAYLEEETAFGRVLMNFTSIIAGLITVLAVVNLFHPVLFTVDSTCVYTALLGRYVILALQIVLLLLLSIYAFSAMHRQGQKDERSVRYRTLAYFGLIMAIFLFAQVWFPYLPLYAIAYMLGTSLLHSFVVLEEKEEYQRDLEEAEKITELKDTITVLLDNIPGMTFTKDAGTGVYLACNQAFAEYANKETPEGVVGHTDAEIFDPETAAHFVADDKIAVSMSGPYVFFEDVPDAAGNQMQIQTTKLKYKDASGRLCVLGMCQDVTDMVRIQHENAMTKEAYETAVSSGIMYTHIAQTLARDYMDMYYVNCDTEEFIEYGRNDEDDAIAEIRRGWHFFSDCKVELSEKVYEDDRRAFLQAMNRKTLMKALSRKNTFIMTYRQISAAGPVYVSMKVSRMEDDERFIIVGITNVDAEMRDAMSKSEALAEALRAAEEANKAKSAFLSSMSHEIRTPMNAIIGLDTLALKRKDMDEETRRYLERIGGSARHLLAIINDILNMSRLESGNIAMRKDEFSLQSMLEQINTGVRSQCEEKGLTYDFHIADEVEEAYVGDETKLKEVMGNILSNAVKFTDAPGTISLTVEKTAEFQDQSTLRFRITDTGIGMDKAFIPMIFEPFSMEDTSNRNKHAGVGLGMAVTKRIVEMMNGSINVESEKDAGTEVTVAVTLRNVIQSAAEEGTAIDPRDLKILVVDDNPIEAEHARAVLEEAGLHADCCFSGEEALRLLEEQHSKHKPYNLVLMDWSMPGMNGLEASAEIQKLYDKETTVVVLTAYNWDDIQEEARRVGVDSFLAKPLFAANILDQFQRITRRSNLAPAVEKKRARLVGRRILLAEDIELNAEIMMDILAMEGIRSDHAENGKEAVDMFAHSLAGAYDAILMDVRMPEMDGLAATEAIRAMNREDAKKIPIIALTANAFDEDVQRSMQAGMNAHLNKPVESDHLMRVLGELIYQAEEGKE